MRRLNYLVWCIGLFPLVVLTSCGGAGGGGIAGLGGKDLMVPAKRIKTPEADYALVTFVRSSVMAFGVKAMIWDREVLVGELTPRNYIQYKVEPGTHLFLAKSENWSYLRANLSAGKHYIVTAAVYPGGNSARIELEPALPYEKKVSKTDVDGWLLGLTPEKVQEDYAEIYADPYLAATRVAIQKYDEGKVDYRTLNAGDDWPHLSLNPPPKEESK